MTTYARSRVLTDKELEDLAKDAKVTWTVQWSETCAYDRKALCRWCHADYYTSQGARMFGESDPDLRRCPRCGEHEIIHHTPCPDQYRGPGIRMRPYYNNVVIDTLRIAREGESYPVTAMDQFGRMITRYMWRAP